jgi:hypothetical protein
MKRAAKSPGRSHWPRRFTLGVILWLLPVALVWTLITPFYNLFLATSAENLVRLSESPAVTRLTVFDRHHFVIRRTDFPPTKNPVSSVRTTDTHFPLVILGAFFLAVPGVPWRTRLENLGWALLVAIFFHIFSLFSWVKFTYATQLGEWSATHYSVWQINFWGLLKHLLDLPFKLALPLLLWAVFYLRLLLPDTTEGS